VSFQIRPIREGEFDEAVAVVEAAFGEVVTPEDVQNERRVAELDRSFAAFADGRMIAGAAAYSFRLGVPGGEVATAGVTSVGVLPTHRRRGLNTALMRRMLDDARERSEPLAALFASEGGIYGRFGFGLGSFSCGMDLETERSAFVRGYTPSGRGACRAGDRSAREEPRGTCPFSYETNSKREAVNGDYSPQVVSKGGIATNYACPWRRIHQWNELQLHGPTFRPSRW